jgi:hypothetical protein
MRKLAFAVIAAAWPLLGAASPEPILLRDAPDGLVPPELSSQHEPLAMPRPPQRVLNGHATVSICFQIDIDTDGHTQNVAVLSGSGDIFFDEDMAKALRGLRWKPATLAGQPVAVRAIFPTAFQGNSIKGADAPAPIPCTWDLYKPDGKAQP